MTESSGDPFGSASGPVIPSGPHTAMTNVAMPKLWIGYLLALATLIGEIVAVARNPDLMKKAEFTMVIPPLEIFLPAFVARAYWLVCVYRYHKILAEVPRYVHPISPAKAVGFHFIPFFNFFWVFAWPSAIADFVNARLRAPVMRKWVVGRGFRRCAALCFNGLRCGIFETRPCPRRKQKHAVNVSGGKKNGPAKIRAVRKNELKFMVKALVLRLQPSRRPQRSPRSASLHLPNRSEPDTA